jgi:predicted Zn-dependent protease
MSTTMPQPPPAHELVDRALELPGVRDRVVVARTRHGANLRWANNTLTTNAAVVATQVSVLSYRQLGDGLAVAARTATASTHEQVAELVAGADAAAAQAPPATDVAPLVVGTVDPDWAEPPVETGIGVYAELAPGLGEAFGRARAQHRVLYGFVDHELTTTHLGSSTGLRRRHVQPTGHWGCTGKPRDLSSSAWVGGATRDFTDVGAAEMEAVLAERLGWARRQVDLPPGRYDTVLPPTAVADLMIYAYWCAGHQAASDGQSAFGHPGGGTRVGERLSRHDVDVLSDPAHPGLEAAPFVTVLASDDDASVFDNGHPLARTSWVEGGVLRRLIRTRHSAAEDAEAASPVVDNLVVQDAAGSGDVMELVAGVDRGLLLTCLWYIREVDPQRLLLTGLTRDGVYLVERGEITGAVNNFRFNESPLSILDRYRAAGSTVPTFSREWGDYFPRTAMPPLRVPDFHMSTVSRAR